jgi:hypothetical protein
MEDPQGEITLVLADVAARGDAAKERLTLIPCTVERIEEQVIARSTVVACDEPYCFAQAAVGGQRVLSSVP